MLALQGLLYSRSAAAQNMYVATNLLDYVNIGTINGEFGLSPWPKYSLYVRVRYNPFTLRLDKQLQNRVAGAALGAKYWLWYSNAGWYINSHLGFSFYNTGGIWNSRAYEGKALSLTAGGGYSLMMGEKWNLDFALGLQGGYTSFTKYACPRCGRVENKGKKLFVAPSNVLVQLVRML